MVRAAQRRRSARTRDATLPPSVLERLPIHGARGGWPKGKRNGMFKHGLYTKEAVRERRLLRELLRQSRGALMLTMRPILLHHS
jgi:hypothetical protein